MHAGRSGISLIGASAALVVAVLLLAATAEAVSPAEPLGHEGRWITDARGRVVVLHGANVVAKGEPALPADRGFGPDDADFLAEHGFNTVRLGVDYSAIEPVPGDYRDDFIEAWVGQLPMLADRGIFTLLDLHQDQYARKYSGNGLPNWMGIDDGLPNTGEGFPNGYLQNPALNRAFDNFWADVDAPDSVSLQAHYTEGLRRIASAAADEPGLLGYDIFNEPWPGSSYAGCASPGGCPGFDRLLLTPFSIRAFEAIRSADPVHLAWYEPNVIFDFGAVTHHGDTGDPNAGFSFHNYCLPGQFVPGTADESCESLEQTVLGNAELQSTLTGDALLMTEFGAAEDAATFERLAGAADRAMVGWQVWTYANYYSGGHGRNQSLVYDTTRPPEGDNVDEVMLGAVARPYPRVIAGTPEGWSFDPDTLEFEASWTTETPDGSPAGEMRSEVFVPDLHYPDGYAVAVEGGEIIGGIGRQRLEVRACPDAERVALEISPGAGPDPRACPEQGGGGAGPKDPPAPGGSGVKCPRGNSASVRCALTLDADGRRVLQVVGTRADERLVGRTGRDIIVCGGGSDRVRARRGGDRIRCGSGGNRIKAGAGNDEVFSGSGPDTVRAGRGGDRVVAGARRDRVRGGRGGDALRAGGGGGPMLAGPGADRLVGGSGPDLMRAGRGDDRLLARGGGRDRLRCGRGDDRVRAGRRDRVGRSCA